MDNIRPTKKQQELLLFIRQFIEKHGYSPTYREMMNGLNYTSVATVAVHVSNLIKRGHLIKRDRSARSIELIGQENINRIVTNQATPSEEKWLIDRINFAFKQVEELDSIELSKLEPLYVLVGSLKILGIEGAVVGFTSRLSKLREKIKH